MTPEELDAVAVRLEEIGAEEDRLRAKLQEQVDEFGFTPPRAEKSKRMNGPGVPGDVVRSTVPRDHQIQAG